MRLLLALLLVLLPGSALADCAAEVRNAWARLRDTPFHFQILMPNGVSEAPGQVVGAFRWPEAMRYQVMGYKGPAETIFIGRWQWIWSEDRWLAGKADETYGPSTQKVLGLHAGLFGLRMLAGEGAFKDAVWLGETARSGRKLVAYTYELRSQFVNEFVDRDTIYVDPVSGFLVHQEIAREILLKDGPLKQQQTAVFKADPALAIVPPETIER